MGGTALPSSPTRPWAAAECSPPLWDSQEKVFRATCSTRRSVGAALPFAQLLRELSKREQHEPPWRGAKGRQRSHGPCSWSWPRSPSQLCLHSTDIISSQPTAADSSSCAPIHQPGTRGQTSQVPTAAARDPSIKRAQPWHPQPPLPFGGEREGLGPLCPEHQGRGGAVSLAGQDGLLARHSHDAYRIL